METLEVRYKPVFLDGNPFVHKYIIYTDRLGRQWIARAGPGGHNIDSLMGSDIVTEVGLFGSKSEDWDAGNPYDREEIAAGEDLSKEWAAIKEMMMEIGKTQYPYDPFRQNSNTSVDRALLAARLKLPSKYALWAPGSGGEFKIPPPANNGVFPHPSEWRLNPPHVMRGDETIPPGPLDFMSVVGHPDAPVARVQDLPAMLSAAAGDSVREVLAPQRRPGPLGWERNGRAWSPPSNYRKAPPPSGLPPGWERNGRAWSPPRDTFAPPGIGPAPFDPNTPASRKEDRLPIPRPNPERFGALPDAPARQAMKAYAAVVEEIEAIERLLRSDRRAYFRDEKKQERYRELLAIREKNREWA